MLQHKGEGRKGKERNKKGRKERIIMRRRERRERDEDLERGIVIPNQFIIF